MKSSPVMIKSKCPSCNQVYSNGIKSFSYSHKKDILFKDSHCLNCDSDYCIIIHLNEFKQAGEEA